MKFPLGYLNPGPYLPYPISTYIYRVIITLVGAREYTSAFGVDPSKW